MPFFLYPGEAEEKICQAHSLVGLSCNPEIRECQAGENHQHLRYKEFQNALESVCRRTLDRLLTGDAETRKVIVQVEKERNYAAYTLYFVLLTSNKQRWPRILTQSKTLF